MIQSSKNCTNNLNINKINWCKHQAKGIKLIKPNKVLARAYFDSAKETLKLIEYDEIIPSNLWLATHKYYFLYFCAYSILMKLGIKSEIHDCTISLIKELEEKEIINLKLREKLESSKIQRIDNQYYLKNEKVNADKEELNFILINLLKLLTEINQDTINKARNLILQN